MSQENVEIVRRQTRPSTVATSGELTFYDENVEAEDLMKRADVPRVVHGIQGFRQMLMAWQKRSTSSVQRSSNTSMKDAMWCASPTTTARAGKAWRRTFEVRMVRVRGVKVARCHVELREPGQALEAVGLSE